MNRKAAIAVIGGGLMVLSAIIARQPLPSASSASSASPPTAVASAAPCHAHDGLPDAACTPGATDPRATQDTIEQTICKPGYTATVRPPVSVTDPIKRLMMQRYGYEGLPEAAVELDHLIPLELGGCGDCQTNLWPQLWNTTDGTMGAHAKDSLENALKRAVCNGTLKLADAQQVIRTDWVAAYQRHASR